MGEVQRLRYGSGQKVVAPLLMARISTVHRMDRTTTPVSTEIEHGDRRRGTRCCKREALDCQLRPAPRVPASPDPPYTGMPVVVLANRAPFHTSTRQTAESTSSDPADVYRLCTAADLCDGGSLHDGMNLVAEEFVCAGDDERGVFILSRFAGASPQLGSALHVNPFAIDETSQALARRLR